MKIYEVELKNANGVRILTVAAKDASQAVEFANRHAKKNYYSGMEITSLRLQAKVDVHYKS